ncbi:MAG: hypothetical protein ACM3X7_11820 [Solirubrobacterales bacterium]
MKKYYSIIIVLITILFCTSCGNSGNKTYEVPNDFIIYGCINKADFIGVKTDWKNIYKYSLADKKLTSIAAPYNKGNFINSVVCNSEWLVWTESETPPAAGENTPKEWQMIAKNLSTGEETVIDKTNFTSKNSSKLFNFTPNNLAISSKNILAYTKAFEENGKAITEIVSYDLKGKMQKVIDKSDTTHTEVLTDCDISDNYIVWCKLKHINEGEPKDISDIYVSDISSGNVQQLTSNDTFNQLSIYGDKIAAIHALPSSSSINPLEIGILNISDKKWTSIVNKDSSIYAGKENTPEINKGIIKLDDKYLSWYDNGNDNRYIYDIRKGSFIKVWDEKLDKGSSVSIIGRYNNYVLLRITDDKNSGKTILVELNN